MFRNRHLWLAPLALLFEYRLMPPFENEGHIFIVSPKSIPQWSPLVSQFLDKHR